AAAVMESIHSWWRANQQEKKTSLLFVHPLGKAQRVLAGLDFSVGPVSVHESIARVNQIYGQMAPVLSPAPSGSLILAPPATQGSQWARKLGTVSTAMASGWMRIRGTRRRRSLDRGFVLSDHADWPALLTAIAETRAETIWVTHVYRAPLTRWLEEQGRHAVAVETPVQEAES